jgi:beta-lactamase superfamily II metal-dependent hydrolase
MKLTILEAYSGDCFILEWGNNNQYSMIIDGGFAGTYYNQLSEIVQKLPGLVTVLITHIDYDHIEGIIKLLNDDSINHDYTLYVNTPELIENLNNSSKVGYQQGEQLLKLINKKKIIVKPIFLPEFPIIEIEGLKCTILSPDSEVIQLLSNNWDEFRQKEIKKKEFSDKVSSEPFILKSIDEILKERELVKNWSNDLINSSSITFIAEFDGKKVLFLADGHPKIIENILDKLGYTSSNPLEVYAIKISHHGSKHNTTKSLIKRIRAQKVIISTNQSGISRHPHREAIIKIANCINRYNLDLEFVFNYPIDFQEFITQEEIKAFNLKFTVNNQVEILS